MRSNFKLALCCGGSLDRADIPVVGRELVLNCEWKRRLQIRGFGFPVDDVVELNAVAGVSRGKTDRLHELRVFNLALYLQCDAHRPILGNPHIRGYTDESTRRW